MRPVTSHQLIELLSKRAGIYITANVNSRIAHLEDCAALARGGYDSDEIEEAMASRLPVSLRDEAIWQYHIVGRGLVFWSADHSFHYVRLAEFASQECVRQLLGWTAILKLFDAYDPVREALVFAEYPDSFEVYRIEADARLTVLRMEPLPPQSNPATRHRSDSSRGK